MNSLKINKTGVVFHNEVVCTALRISVLLWRVSPSTGRFNISTPYNVSLFTVDNGNRIHHISSVIGYSLEQSRYLCIISQTVVFLSHLLPFFVHYFSAPPRVPSFKVLSIAAHQVTLIWEPIPLSKQNGVIQCYQIGVVGQNGKYCDNVQYITVILVKVT